MRSLLIRAIDGQMSVYRDGLQPFQRRKLSRVLNLSSVFVFELVSCFELRISKLTAYSAGFARLAHRISRSLRIKTQRLAKAGCAQQTPPRLES